MTQYYVKPSGDDGNDGLTWPTAWRTLNMVLLTCVGGDIATFQDGTYSNVYEPTQRSGSSGNPITLIAENRRGATLTFSGVGLYFNHSYYVLDGFIVDGGNLQTGQLVRVRNGASNITIQNCDIVNTNGHGIYVYGSGPSYVYIYDCLVNPNYSLTAHNARDGISLESAHDCVILRCTVLHSDHNGINCNGSYNVTIGDCTVYDVGNHRLSVGSGSHDVEVYRCMAYNTGAWGHTYGGCGIFMAGGGQYNVRVHHCAFYNCLSPAVYFRGDFSLSGPTRFDHNIAVGCCMGDLTEGQVRSYLATTAATIQIRNNIFICTRGEWFINILSGVNLTNWYLNSNCYWSQEGTERFSITGTSYTSIAAYIAGAKTDESDSLDENPVVEDLANHIFLLDPASPCIDAGEALGLGDPVYGSAPDMGPNETYPNLLGIRNLTTTVAMFTAGGFLYTSGTVSAFAMRQESDPGDLLATMEKVLNG